MERQCASSRRWHPNDEARAEAKIERSIKKALQQSKPTPHARSVESHRAKQAMAAAEAPSQQSTVVAGAASGITGSIVGYPMDSVKTRLQASGDTDKSPRDVLQRTLRNEGIRGLYRGITPPLVSLTLLNSIVFSSYHQLMRPLVRLQPGELDPLRVPLAGALCCIPASIVSTPFEVLKVQASVSFQRFGIHLSSFDVLRRVGVNPPLLYSGYSCNCLREMLFLATYFGCFEHARSFAEAQSLPSAAAVPLAGGISGAASWATSFPLDVLKSKVCVCDHPPKSCSRCCCMP